MSDRGFFKEGFQKVGRKVVEPCPLPVNSLSLFGRFVYSVTLFALHCEAEGNLLHMASHLVAASTKFSEEQQSQRITFSLYFHCTELGHSLYMYKT